LLAVDINQFLKAGVLIARRRLVPRNDVHQACRNPSCSRESSSPTSCRPTRSFGELLIDLEEDKAARAVVFGLLAEMGRK
jgi:hypothetical protein